MKNKQKTIQKGETNINQDGNKNVAYVNSTVVVNDKNIYEEIHQLIKDKKITEATELIDNLQTIIDNAHPFSPYYRYNKRIVGGKVFYNHEPVNEQASKDFPLKFKGKFKIITEDFNSDNVKEVLDEAYINQRPIKIDMEEIQAFIADQPVDTPNLNTKESDWEIVPEPLPEPLRLKFYIKNEEENVLYDYLEMSLVNIDRDSNKITLDNSAQSISKLYMSLQLHLPFDNQESNETELIEVLDGKLNFSVKETNLGNIQAHLKFLEIIKNVNNNPQHEIAFRNLDKDKDILVTSSLSIEETPPNLVEDINLLKKLKGIENAFNIEFSLPEYVTNGDMNKIEMLESILKDEAIKIKFNNLVMKFSDRPSLIDLYEEMIKMNGKGTLLKTGHEGEDAKINLFNKDISFSRLERTFPNVKIENIKKLKRKIDDMELGEIITVKFIPTRVNEAFEKYTI